VPDALAVVVHRVVLLGPVSVTVLLGVAVPDIVGEVVAIPLLAGLVIPTVGTSVTTIPTLVAIVMGLVQPNGRLPFVAINVTT
jgi:hypothetical protein